MIGNNEFLFGSYVRGIGWGEIRLHLQIWIVDFFENVSLLNQTRHFSIQETNKIYYCKWRVTIFVEINNGKKEHKRHYDKS